MEIQRHWSKSRLTFQEATVVTQMTNGGGFDQSDSRGGGKKCSDLRVIFKAQL